MAKNEVLREQLQRFWPKTQADVDALIALCKAPLSPDANAFRAAVLKHQSILDPGQTPFQGEDENSEDFLAPFGEGANSAANNLNY